MDRVEAAAVLGVPVDADAVDARSAYLRLVRVHHPDVAPDRAEATAETALLTQAWSVLRASAPPVAHDGGPGGVTPPDSPPTWGPVDHEPDLDAPVPGGAPAGFMALLEAASSLGEVTWADRHAQMVQVVLRPQPDGPTCQLVAGLVTTPDGLAVRTALESLENREAPPLEPLAELLAVLVAEAVAGG